MTFLSRYLTKYEPYKYVNSNECELDIEKFLRKDKSLKEYRKKIDYLLSYINDISLFPLQVPMNLFLVDCSKLNQVKQL